MIPKYNCGDIVLCHNPFDEFDNPRIGTIVSITIHTDVTYMVRFEYRPPLQNFKTFLMDDNDIIEKAEVNE